MKHLGCLVVLVALSACDLPLPEATCSCFDGNGDPTGNCQFEPVAGAPHWALAGSRGVSNPADVSEKAEVHDPC